MHSPGMRIVQPEWRLTRAAVRLQDIGFEKEIAHTLVTGAASVKEEN